MSSLLRRRQHMSAVSQPDAVLVLDLPLVSTKEDISGNNHVVTESDVIYYPDGALLDENTDYIRVADSADLSFTDGTNDKPFSISCDFIPISNSSVQRLISKDNSSLHEYLVYYYNNSIYFILYSQGGASIYKFIWTNTYNFVLGISHNVICTYDGTIGGLGMKIYINGAIVSITPNANASYVSMANTTAEFVVGKYAANTLESLIGSIKNVKIFSGVFTPLQITNLQPTPTIEASTTKLYIPYYGNLSDKSNNTKSLISGGSALDYLTKPRWLKSGANVYQQITSNIADLSFYTSRVDNQFSVSFKYNFSSNSNVSWFNKSNGTDIEYSIKYDTVLGIVIILRDNVVGAEYKYTKLFTPILNTNYAFAFTHTGGVIALGNLKLLINGQLQTATTEVFPSYVSMSSASGGTQQVNITKLHNGNSEYLNGSIKNLKVESLAIPQSTAVKYANDAEYYRVLDMQFNGDNGNISGKHQYGYLYNQYAVDTNKLAPKGWHVPTQTEYETLKTFIGATEPSKKLREVGTTYWSTNNGQDTYGFKLRGSGFRNISSGYVDLKTQTLLWTSTNGIEYDSWWDAGFSFNGYTVDKKTGCSVRCLRDSGNTETTVTDIDGNLYTSVTIGTQTWLVQNLAVTKYNDGTSIPLVTDNTAWSALTTGAYCSYNNVSSNAMSGDLLTHDTTDTAMIYSNNQAVFNGSTSKITIANSSDLSFTNGSKDLPFSIDIRFNRSSGTGFYLVYKQGEYLIQYTGTSLDIYLYTDGSNYKKLSYTVALTNGIQNRATFTYYGVGLGSLLWNNTLIAPTSNTTIGTYTRMPLSGSPIYFGQDGSNGNVFNGTIDYCTIYNRVLIQDEITNGICNTYDIATDCDGNVYNTITIGGQTWCLENSKVTHYNNGDPITNVTDNTAWGALTTEAYSWWNNDISNKNRGAYYNWFVGQDARGIAPVGYRVATNTDWQTLATYAASNFGTSLSASKALCSNSIWTSSSATGAPGNNYTINNYLKFAATPFGIRDATGGFTFELAYPFFWTPQWATKGGVGFDYDSSTIYIGDFTSGKKNGGNIRFIKL